MITFPNAKINLGLNIIEKRPDGYHNLETVFYPINLQDALEVVTAEKSNREYTVHVSGTPLAEVPEDNIVVKAYQLLKKDYSLPPVNIHLFKHIPSGAGLGGGSADAAFMIKSLNEKYHLGMSDLKMEEYAAKLGADCAFFIKNKPVFATGIGNIFEPVDISLKGYYVIVVKPDEYILTGAAFKMIKPKRPEVSLKEIIRQPVEAWREMMKNDFEEALLDGLPEVRSLKRKLYDMGAVYASMSGSGSAVYGLFKEQIADVDKIFDGIFCRQRELE